MSHSEKQADIVIIGGSLGGCAAALAAVKMGRSVIMTEKTDWIGGQLTSQAVPPDEHPWIEQFGCTQSYRRLRDGIRSYYQRNFILTPDASKANAFNPGNAIVSQISHEPRAALSVLLDMLAPYIHSGLLTLLTKHKPLRAETEGDHIRSVIVENLETTNSASLIAPYFLDATEEGDVLPLAGVEYITGAESIHQTGEPHALHGEADPMEMQAFTYCFAMDYIEGEYHVIERPRDYNFWKHYKADFWPCRHLSWTGVRPDTLEPVDYSLFSENGLFSLWNYRRIIDKRNFAPFTYKSDITLVNWPQNDYWLGPIIDVKDEERKKHLEQAKQLSLSLLYWMQTEAPRPDGKLGYQGLRLRADVVGTEDGLAKYPYIRESRRLKAEFTVLEQHISPAVRGEKGPAHFHDSVGVGCYRIDLHPSTSNHTYIDVSSFPFQIPLGSLIPVRMENLLAACKNIGVTHITNGCYRLHPVEWNIGEAAGYLSAFCIIHNVKPRQVRNESKWLEEFQAMLRNEGVELDWPNIHAV